MAEAPDSHWGTGRWVRGHLLRDIREQAAGVYRDACRGEGASGNAES